MEEISPELIERMVALVRELHADHVANDMHDRVQDFVARTAAVVADLPDADIIQARKVIAETYGQTRMLDGSAMHGEGPARVEQILTGRADGYWEMRAVIAAIKRGRELERQS